MARSARRSSRTSPSAPARPRSSTLVDPRKKEFLDLTHVGAGNIESRTGVFVGLKTAREEGLISGKFLFDESMVLYSKIRPYLMKVARPDFPGLCSADMYPLAPFPKEITRDYLFHLLLSKTFTDYAVIGSARAGMPKVNREHLFEFKTWLPDLRTQKQTATRLDSLSAETRRLAAIYGRKQAALTRLTPLGEFVMLSVVSIGSHEKQGVAHA